MSWVTVIWSMIASSCLTVAAIYCLVWYRNRSAWTHLLFAVTAVSTTALAFCELRLMRADTLGEVLAVRMWAHVPLFLWLVSVTWFVRIYLGAGRPWLAWTITGLRAVVLAVMLLAGSDPGFGNVSSLRHVEFLGEQVTVLGAAPTLMTPVAQFASLLILIFVADASVTVWRRGERRKALKVGVAVEFFMLGSLGTAMAVLWGGVETPIPFSFFYLGLVAVMGYELSRDVLRASQLVRELQLSEAGLRESEARMSLALDAADFGILVRDFTRNEIWASERWRELFGFAQSQPLEVGAILTRVHPDDRQRLERAQAMALAGTSDGRYETEYRLLFPDGGIRWILSRGRVEHDATGQPILARGASRDVTARKRAELAARDLSGRLLSAQEDERRRIARELHDNVSQQMAVLAIKIAQLTRRHEDIPASMSGAVRELSELAATISTEIHDLSHRLHSSKVETLGLVRSLRGHCQELLTLGIHATFDDQIGSCALPPEVELSLFRIAQEGLNNIVKHSGASEAHVTVRVNGDVIELTVTDPGRGFDAVGAAMQKGLGIGSMRERARLIDGELRVHSQPGQGTTIWARVPMPRASEMVRVTQGAAQGRG